jgi:signal transduction histidine kinase
MVTYVLACSIILQLTTAVLALRLIRLTGRRTAWSLIAVALVFLSSKRAIPLYRLLSGDSAIAPDLSNELIGLVVSLLLLLGVISIASLFAAIKRSEEALLKSQASHAEAQRIAHLGHWELNLTTNRLDWSEEVFRIFEIDPEKFHPSYEGFLDTIHPEDRAFVDQAYTESVKSRTPYDIGHRLMMKDGSVKFVNDRCETSYDEFGKPLRSIGTVLDITERKSAERQIRWLARFPEENPNPVIRVAQNGTILYANPASNSLKRHATLFVEEVASPWLRTLLEKAYDSGLVIETEATFDGTTNRLTVTPVVEEGYLNVYARDITERKRAENIIQARLRLLEFADSHSMDELLTATLDELEALTGSTIGFYHFVESDQETLSLQNWSTNTLKNMCTAAGKGSHYDIAKAGVWTDCVRERRPIVHNDYASLPHRKGMPEGHAPVVREVVVPILRGNLIKAIIGVGNKSTNYSESDIEIVSQLGDLSWDITESKRAEEEIRELNQELEQRVMDRTAQLQAANKELEAFSYSVSHDLRAPLRALDGFSRILIEDYAAQLPAEAVGHLNRVRNGASQMGRLIDDLLRFSRLSRQPLEKQPVNLSALVQETWSTMESEHKERQVELVIGSLPECQGDPSLLRQVFLNLLSNALKYSRRSADARIEIGCLPQVVRAGEPPATNVYFVKDNGVGFDMQFADKLFGVFQRLHRPEEYEGMGVGLAIVHRIIARHGGRIWAESEPDKGATFYLTIGETQVLRSARSCAATNCLPSNLSSPRGV